jgi:hypothetical protein
MADVISTFRLLNFEQKVAAVGAVLLAVSTFGPFSFVEVAEIAVAVGVLALLRARALGKRFHLPFGDGTVIAAAGAWAALLIVVRLFDRSLGQNLLALVCAAILLLAGVSERAKRPADDLPPEAEGPEAEGPEADGPEAAGRRQPDGEPEPNGPPPARPRRERSAPGGEPLPPPEFEPYQPQEGEQLRLGGEERQPPGDA